MSEIVKNVNIPNQIKPISPQSSNQKIVRPHHGPSFNEILADQMQPMAPQTTVRFSGHAQERLRTRSIELSQDRMQRLQEAIEKANRKGAKESLVLMDDIALIVSIKNNVVITAASGKELKESVFTNIDSAVIA